MEKILEVTEVKLTVLEGLPSQLQIIASGTVRTGGWFNPKLIPHIHIQAPPDGIYGFDFVADPPEGIAAQVISPINVLDQWDDFPANVKGVRIHASQNSITALLDGAGRPHRQPNRYTFSDGEGVKRVIFFPRALGPLGSDTSAAGAQLEYNGSEGQLTFRGEDVGQEQTVLGTLISVVLRPSADAGGLDFALVLPPVNLGGEARQKFETMGIIIHGRARMMNPAGAELTYEVLQLTGIAEDIPIL